MPDGLASWLQQVPGWETADVKALAGGRSNRAFRLTAGNRSAVLKFDQVQRAWPGNSRLDEANVQRVAAASGLAAPVVWCSPECIVTEWLPGRALAARDLREPASLQAVGETLRRVHALPRCEREFAPASWADYYRDCLDTLGRFDRVAKAAYSLLCEARLPGPYVLAHNDLVPANVVVGDEVQFIDWEYASFNSWQFDLATLHVEAGLDAAATKALFYAYSGDAKVPADFTGTVAVYRALVTLWERAQLPVIP